MNAIQVLVRILTLAVILVLKVIEFACRGALILCNRGAVQVKTTTPKVRDAAVAGYTSARADAPSRFASLSDRVKTSAKAKLETVGASLN